MSKLNITDTIKTIILSCTVLDGHTLQLPPDDLPRDQYMAFDKACKAAGGAWKRGKGHVFPSESRLSDWLQQVRGGAVVRVKQATQAFYTPASIAEVVADFADVGGYLVLEPSAGCGSLARACLNAGAGGVHCVEMDPVCEPALRKLPHVSVEIGDFLKKTPGKFNRIVMNPPFTKGQCVKHVAHAKKFLLLGGSLFAIVPALPCAKLDALGAVTVTDFPSGAFKESGTNVATRLIRIVNA